VNPYLERYLAEGRPALLKGKDSSLVFVGQKGNPEEPLNSLDVRLQYITSQYLPNSPGFRAHSMRHLVTTAWLIEHPRDYVRAAHMLFDSLQTVLRVYGHLETGETLADWGKWLSAIKAGRKRP
jgi:site-specific recombinase XerD